VIFRFFGVPNVFPKPFPIAPQFFSLILFGHGSTSMYISYKEGWGKRKHDKACFYFGGEKHI
jgi:hypothetical protein